MRHASKLQVATPERDIPNAGLQAGLDRFAHDLSDILGCQNGAGGPPAWETFHLDELRRLLEDGYGVGRRRVAAGLSMGGFGALTCASRRPGMFRAAASFSGPPGHILHPSWGVLPRLDQGCREHRHHPDLGRPGARHVRQEHDPCFLAERLKRTPVYLSGGDGRPGPLDAPSAELDESEAHILQANRAAVARFGEPGFA